MRENRYLRDRMIGRSRDGRNPYGSRGGYVTSSRRGRDRMMSRDMEQDMARGRDSEMDYARNRDRANYHDVEQAMYGRDERRGGRGRDRADYADYGDYNDYGDYEMDYAEMDEEYKEDLEKLCHKLKKKDRFKLTKEDIIKKAKQMGVTFEDFDELEFLTVYYMMMSDYPNVANDAHQYLAMAKDWLMDDDIEVSPSEKLSIYFYKIIKGE